MSLTLLHFGEIRRPSDVPDYEGPFREWREIDFMAGSGPTAIKNRHLPREAVLAFPPMIHIFVGVPASRWPFQWHNKAMLASIQSRVAPEAEKLAEQHGVTGSFKVRALVGLPAS